MAKRILQSQNPQDNDADGSTELKHHYTPVHQHSSFSILEIAAFAALIIGVFQYAQNGDPKLFVFGCILAAAKEGPSAVKSILILIKEWFRHKDPKN